MISARDAILRRIEQVNTGQASADRLPWDADYSAIPRGYIRKGTLSESQVVELFLDRLQDYGCEVQTVVQNDLSAAVGRLLAFRGKKSLLVAPGIPGFWLPANFDFIRAHPPIAYDELDRAEGVLTGCNLAIAATGTIILAHSSEAGSRALTLIPDYHLCVVFTNQVVETVPEGIEGIRGFAKLPITTISGPSATSDIEMTRIKGVHGPRTLDIILVAP